VRVRLSAFAPGRKRNLDPFRCLR